MRWPQARLLGLAGAGVLLGSLYFFPPTRYGFYPACPIHYCTGLLCPGCGATRALAALLHGGVHQAIQYNAFFTLAILPCAMVYAVAALSRGRWVRMPVSATAAFGLAAVIFTIARNLH